MLYYHYEYCKFFYNTCLEYEHINDRLRQICIIFLAQANSTSSTYSIGFPFNVQNKTRCKNSRIDKTKRHSGRKKIVNKRRLYRDYVVNFVQSV